jgi:hypothetical protein
MPITTQEHIGTVFNFLALDKNEVFSESSTKKRLLIPFAQTRITAFNTMIIGSRPSSGRTLFLNELLIANALIYPSGFIIDSPEPSRLLAYFLTENPANYFNKFIPGIIGVNLESLSCNRHFRDSSEFKRSIIDLDATLSKRPLFLEFSLPSAIDEFITAIEKDIETCNPDFIFIDGIEALAQPENREYENHGTRNIDLWLDACLQLSKKHSIPFIITRLLNPQYDRSFDLYQPVFSDFNSSTIDSSCDIVVSMVRPCLNGVNPEYDRLSGDRAVHFFVHRDRTGNLSGKYKCEIEIEIPRMVFPKKDYI